MKNTINTFALFSISARADVEQQGVTYEATFEFFKIRSTMPVQMGKEMKHKVIFGSKAKATVAKEDGDLVRASEFFSLEEVAEFFSGKHKRKGKDLHSFKVMEHTLPLPIGGDYLSMADQVGLADRPRKWGLGTEDASLGALVVRDEQYKKSPPHEIEIESAEIPF